MSFFLSRCWRPALLAAGIFFSLACHDLSARPWSTTDGKFQVEGKLLSADSQQAVLKLEDQRVINVPLAAFSRDDRDFIEQALAKSDSFRTAYFNQTHSLLRPEFQPPAQVNGDWRSAVDPQQIQFAIPAGSDIPFSVNLRDDHPDSDETCVFPATPSPFFFHAPTMTVCDLRDASVQVLKNAPTRFVKSAMSPDGKLVAFLLTAEVDSPKVGVVFWNVATDDLARSVPLPTLDDEDPHIELFAFAGVERIVVKEFSAEFFMSLAIGQGSVKRLPCDRSSASRGGHAISPGGRYLFFYPDQGESKRLLVYDLSTGKPHGALAIPAHPNGPSERNIAHIDTSLGINNQRRASLWIDGEDGMSVSPNGRFLIFYFSRQRQGEVVCYDLQRGSLTTHSSFERSVNTRSISWYGDDAGWLVDGETYYSRETGQVCDERERLTDEVNRSARFVDTDKLFYVDKRETRVIRQGMWEIEKRMEHYAANGTEDDLQLPRLTAVTNPLPPAAWVIKPGARLPAAPAPPVALRDVAQTASVPKNSPPIRFYNGLSSNVGHIVAPDGDHHICRFDMTTGEVANYAPPKSVSCKLRDFSPSGRYALFTLANVFQLRLDVFDAETMQPYVSIRTSRNKVDRDKSIVWSALIDDQHLALITTDGVLSCCVLPSCQMVYSVQMPFIPTGAFLSPQRDRIAVTGKPSEGVAIVDSSSGEALALLPEKFPTEVEGKLITGAFSRDGKKITAVYDPSNIRLFSTWNLETGQPLQHVKSRDLVEHLIYVENDNLLGDVRRPNPGVLLFPVGDFDAPQTIQPTLTGRNNPEYVIAGGRVWYRDSDRLFPLVLPTEALR